MNSDWTTTRRTSAYICFFIVGLIVAGFQWRVVFALDRSGLVADYLESIFLISLFAIPGIMLAINVMNPTLWFLLAATLLFFTLQFVSGTNNLVASFLDIYARLYALSCLVGPLITTYIKSWYVRAVLFSVLAAVIIGFSVLEL